MSRIQKTLKNTRIALFFLVLNLSLNFVLRDVLLGALGPEIVGVNALANNLVGLLNLAELGIVSAIASSLYKPLSDNDKVKISEIVSLQGILYQKVARFIIILSFLLMFFFPFLFSGGDVPIYYSYLIFSILLVNSLLGYFITYGQVLLFADMRYYKLNYIKYSLMAAKVIFQIVCLKLLDNSLYFWLILEFVFPALSSFFIYKLIRREYPWLEIKLDNFQALKIKYRDVFHKIKKMYFHKIAGVAQSQTIPIILYFYTSLSDVAKYDNYLLIIMGINIIFSAVTNSLQPAVGNLVANVSKKTQLKFFENYILGVCFLAGLFSFLLYHQLDDFIVLWLGENFVLNKFTLIVIVINLFLSIVRTFDIFIYAYGLFDDVVATIFETSTCILTSIILGYFWGMPGVLLGTTLGLLLVPCCWRGYFLYKYGFGYMPHLYFKKVCLGLLCVFFSIVLSYYLMLFFLKDIQLNYISWLQNSLSIGLIYFLSGVTVFIILSPDFRKSLKILYHIVNVRISNK